MATIRAAANGNWSAGATWIGGVVPTSADDVVANSFTVQIDSTYTVLSARNDTTGGATAGGTFAFTNNSSLTCTASQAIHVGSTTPVLTFTLASGNTATFNGNILTITSVSGYRAILQSNTGTLNCVGNYNLDGLNANVKCIIQSTAAGILNILGNVTNTMTTGGNANATIISSGGATINITAPVFSGGGAPGNTFINALLVSNGGNVTLTGNPVANITPAINIVGGSLTIIGNPQGSSTAPAVLNITNACTINVIGTPTAGSGANAIVGLGLVRITGNPINTNRFMAIYAPQVTIDATTNSWTFQQFAGADITLYASGASLGNPVQADVREGTAYGPSGTLIGTLRVPNPNTVLLGNLTDNTTGTLIMTPQQFWEALTSSVTLSGSFGKLIKDFLNAAVGSIPTNPLLTTDTRLNNLDATISSRNAVTPPTVDAIRAEMDSNSTKLANLDTTISSRMATFTYTAPDNASIIAIKLKTDTILWADIVNIKTKTDTIVWTDVTALINTAGDIKTKTDTIDWTDIVAIKAKTDTIDWGDVTSVTTSISGLETDIANIPTNPVLDTDSRLDYLDAPVSGAGGGADLQPVLDAVAEVPQLVLQEITDSPTAIAERLRNVSTVQTTGEQLASYTNS